MAVLANENGGDTDLHSALARENVVIIKDVMEHVSITGDPAMVQEERRKFRPPLAGCFVVDEIVDHETDGSPLSARTRQSKQHALWHDFCRMFVRKPH